MGINEKGWFGGFKRLIKDESLGETLGLAVDNATKQLHIIDIADADTDWALSADSYPAVYIHGSASATEYIKMMTDSTDAHFNVVGANLDIDVPSSSQVAIQVNNTDEYTFDATTLSLGSNTITNAGNITQLAGAKYGGTQTTINSTAAINLEIGGVDLLFMGSVSTATAALNNVAGLTAYINAQNGGIGSTSPGGTGGHIFIVAGNAGTSLTGTGGAGGNIRLTAGTSTSGVGASAGGAGGLIILEPGVFGGTTSSPGYVQILGSASWVATSTSVVNLGTTGPATGTTVSEWFTIKNASGAIRYIPAWAAA